MNSLLEQAQQAAGVRAYTGHPSDSNDAFFVGKVTLASGGWDQITKIQQQCGEKIGYSSMRLKSEKPTRVFKSVAGSGGQAQQLVPVKDYSGLDFAISLWLNEAAGTPVLFDCLVDLGYAPTYQPLGEEGVQCVYQAPVRQSKDHLRNEIETLRQKQQSTNAVLAGLKQPHTWAEVLARVQADQPVEHIAAWVRGQTDPSHPAPSAPAGTEHAGHFTPDGDAGWQCASPSDMSEPSAAPFSMDDASINGLPLAFGARSSVNLFDAWNKPPKFSTNTQTQWAASISRNETLRQTPMLPEPAGSRLASWAEETRADHITDSSQEHRGLHQAISSLDDPWMKQGTSTWTCVTSDMDLVQHLLALYFSWEYPTFASLSKEHFLLDFNYGRQKYCSPLLVNALLSLGCRFSRLSSSKADPPDPYSSGQHFFDETLRLLRQETDYHSLTTIQALGIMSIREASCGRVAESVSFAEQSMRLAVEMGLHRIDESGEQDGDDDEFAVRSATFWGAFSLDQFLRKPHKPPVIAEIEATLWIPYTDSGAPLQQCTEQPSNVRSIFKCFCELSDVVHEALYLLYSPGEPLAASSISSIYAKYLQWYEELPEVLRLGRNFTPSVLFAHYSMFYHFAVLLLFRPIIHLRLIDSQVCPRDVCLQAAHALHALLRAYAQLYTLKWTPAFLPHFVLTSSVTHLAIGVMMAEADSAGGGASIDAQFTEAVKEGMDGLAEMAPCHHFAEQALNILRYLVQEWNLEVDVGAGPVLEPEDYDKFVRPYASTLNFFRSSTIASDIISDPGMERFATDGEMSRQVGKAKEMMENLLLRPIPLQGPSVLLKGKGKEMDKEGFAKF
ncbi:amino-acid permease inda1 [Purpureocillium lavendulum]|uniref:Amino-acid permease inda1 n=1 Tax=Purpureocillium lavendulum TaxID=1247861 RepID=A0AB34FHC7_9HYPO|nr:amino-acid permease inda1 [Purpureocillium lavendulum]